MAVIIRPQKDGRSSSSEAGRGVASVTTNATSSSRRAGTNTKYLTYWFLVGIAALCFLVGGRYHGYENTNTNVDHSLLQTSKSDSHGDIHTITRTSQSNKNNLDILQKATALDLSYVDVTRGPEQDLRRGVKDEAGNYDGAYVLDEQALRRNPPALNWTGDHLLDACKLRDSEYNMIDKKISIAEKNNAQPSRPPQRILCVVQTSLHRHQKKIPVIRETWGQKCDGFVVASNVTDPSLGTVGFHVPGDDDVVDSTNSKHNREMSVYQRKWLRVRSLWALIYDNHYQDYDWFFFGGDFVFVIVENLRFYLESDEIQAAANYGGRQVPLPSASSDNQQYPLFLGRRFDLGGGNQEKHDVYNAAASGYVVNKAALKLFVVDGGNVPDALALPQKHTSGVDLMIARLFRRFGVYPYDTKDDSGGERFMVTTPGHHYDSKFPAWYHKQSIDIQHGLDHCAAHSISFTYVPEPLMYRLHALLYGLCPPT